MMALFAGHQGAHGTHGEPAADGSKWEIKKTARTLREPVTVRLWEQHLAGKRPLGIVPIREDNQCLFGGIDVDVYGVDHLGLIAAVRKACLPFVPVRSKSGGLHLFMFLKEPVQAKVVQALLRDAAALLGLPKETEIFPKQGRIDTERGDVGNWILMPYYGDDYAGRLKRQVGIAPDGREMSVEEFVETAEAGRLTTENLIRLPRPKARSKKNRSSRAKVFDEPAKPGKGTAKVIGPATAVDGAMNVGDGWAEIGDGPSTIYHEPAMIGDGPAAVDDALEDFSDAPPCLQALARDGVSEGGRDNALLMFGIYFRRRDPEGWEALVEEANQRFMKPPLPHGDVRRIVGSLRKKDYLYTCKKEPMLGLCDAATCQTRRLGIGGGSGVRLDEFIAYLPTHTYIFRPTREPWPAASVNSQIPPVDVGREKRISASAWLDTNAAVQQMIWAPGLPELIRDQLVSDGGWIERPGSTIFNLYRPPAIIAAEGDVSPWLDHARKLYGEEADHLIKYLAHCVQRPHVKINHALVLGGHMGIGKDTILHPVKQAVGPWNFHEVSPEQVMDKFTGFLKSVVLRVSEAKDLGDSDRFKFYDRMKAYTAAPPDVLRVNEKNLREHYIFNVLGVILTTNHKTDGIYLPADDRRHYVLWTDLTKENFAETYWNALWGWYEKGGDENVAHYLATLDLSGFNAKAPPPKTDAFWEIVNASRAPEDAELADALDRLKWPKVVTLETVAIQASDEFRLWLNDRRNARRVPHRFEEVGYVPVRNPGTKAGFWQIGGRRQVVYAKRDLTLAEKLAAATALYQPDPGDVI